MHTQLKSDNYGFGAIAVIAILLVVLAAGGAGYTVYKKGQKTSTTASSQSNTQTSSNTKTTVSTAQFLNIPEFGVKIPLTANTQDLTYLLKTDEKGQQYAALTTQFAKDFDKGCDPSVSTSGGLGVVAYYSNPNELAPTDVDGTVTMKQAFPDAVTVSGKSYYLLPDYQTICYDQSKDGQPGAKKVSAALADLKKAKPEAL